MDEKNVQLPEDLENNQILDEILEGIVGGQFSEGQIMWLEFMISRYKDAGKTLDDMIAYNHCLPNVPADIVAEMDEYVRNHW